MSQLDPRFVLTENEIQYLLATSPQIVPATAEELEALTALPEEISAPILERFSRPRFPTKYTPQQMREDMSIPRTGMHGKLRDAVKHCNTDLSTTYLFALAALAPVVRVKGEAGFNLRQELSQTNLNVAACMPSGRGKAAALTQICELLWGKRPPHLIETTLASEIGIMSRFPAEAKVDDPNHKGAGPVRKIKVPVPTAYVCVTNDELSSMFLKMNIENSALQAGVNSLYAMHEIGNSIGGRETSRSNVELSLLGALPVENEEEFAKYFTDRFAEGFGRRVLISYTPDAQRPRSDWECPIEPLNLPPIMQVTVTREIIRLIEDVWFAYYDRPEHKHLSRLASAANLPILRIAAITSAVNGDKEITLEALHAAFALLDWQIQLKHKLRPGSSDKDAQFSERLLTTLKKWQDKKGYQENGEPKMMNYSALYRHANLSRLGSAQKIYNGLKALHQNGQIELGFIPNDDMKRIEILGVTKGVK